MNYVVKIRRFYDADRWITVHPNGADKKGSPVKIGPHGEVKGGMGGKFTGRHISAVSHHGANEQAGAQMVIDRIRQFFNHGQKEPDGGEGAKPRPFKENPRLRKKLPPEFYDAAMDAISNAPRQQLRVWQKFGTKVKCITADNKDTEHPAYFSWIHRGVSFVARDDKVGNAYEAPYAVFFHEFAHNIDYLAAGAPLFRDAAFSEEYKGGAFKKTIEKELRASIGDYFFRSGFRSLPKRDAYVLSDAVSSFVDPTKYGHSWGHDPEYWEEDPDRVASETFANLYAAAVVNQRAYAATKKYFPKTVKLFEEIMEEIVK